MKNLFIFLTIFVIGLIAFYDAKERLQQLDEISANTPAQVEMKQMMNKPDTMMNKDNIQYKNNIQSLDEKALQNDRPIQQNQLNNIDKRRDTIINRTNSINP